MHKLSKYLDKKRIEQQVFADQLGVSKSHMSRILSGDRRPSLDLLRRMAEKTGIPASELLQDVPRQ